MRPPKKLQAFANFWPQNKLQPFITRPYSPPEYFLFPKLKIKLKGLHFAGVAEI
jgi:hypothetical protein